jgi:hypothetical protein
MPGMLKLKKIMMNYSGKLASPHTLGDNRTVPQFKSCWVPNKGAMPGADFLAL